MKKIIITGGSTNEPIDEIMRIITMGTGSLSLKLGEFFLKSGYRVCLILNRMINTDKIEMLEEAEAALTIVPVETTADMMNALEAESKKGHTDAIIHASAVNDYKTDYTFLLEDLAKYIWNEIESGKITSEEALLAAMEDGEKYNLDNSSKISSYQKNLTVKLGLTPKIISRLRGWYGDTLLIGCKLLENVPKEELYDVAHKLCNKNDMDYILANDLADLRRGNPARYLVNKDGFTGKTLETPENIFAFVDGCLKA